MSVLVGTKKTTAVVFLFFFFAFFATNELLKKKKKKNSFACFDLIDLILYERAVFVFFNTGTVFLKSLSIT